MFEVGFTEIILILGIALVVLGPQKLPGLASRIGRWLGRARAMTRQLKIQLDDEVLHADEPWLRQRRTWQPPSATPPPAADPDAPRNEAGDTASAPDDTDAKPGP